MASRHQLYQWSPMFHPKENNDCIEKEQSSLHPVYWDVFLILFSLILFSLLFLSFSFPFPFLFFFFPFFHLKKHILHQQLPGFFLGGWAGRPGPRSSSRVGKKKPDSYQWLPMWSRGLLIFGAWRCPRILTPLPHLICWAKEGPRYLMEHCRPHQGRHTWKPRPRQNMHRGINFG